MLRLRHLAALLLLAGCSPSPSAPARVVDARVRDRPVPRGAALLRAAMQAGHDAARAAAGVAPLAWSDALAADAQGYADTLARERRFAHAPQPQGSARQSENLWTGTRGAYLYREMVEHWVAERWNFVNAPTPGFSRTGRWQDVAHYAQIVWRGTAALGCGFASNAADDYLVCRYAPAGNVVGERAY